MSKFKKGDLARILSVPQCFEHSFKGRGGVLGMVCKITSNGKEPYHLDDNKFCVNFVDSNLELASNQSRRFYVGDELKIVKQVAGHGFKIGETVRVTEILSGVGSYKCKSLSSMVATTWSCIEEELEKKQPIKNFKVGDKVKAISESIGWGSVSAGDIGFVSKVSINGEIEVDFPGFFGWSCYEDNLELESNQMQKLKSGDRVRISSNCNLSKHNDWQSNFGKDGTIRDKSNGTYYVNFDDGSASALFEDKDLELINNTSSSDDKTTMKKTIKSFAYGINQAYRKGEVKVGDRVRIKNASSCWISYPAFVTLTKVSDGCVDWRSGNCGCSDLDRPFDMEIDVDDTPITIPTDGLDKVILPKETKEEIIAVLKQHQHQDKIFKEWGLGETIEYGKGMTFLFYGTPGTGKTWCATQMAKLMNRELLVLSPAEVQSQEPGGANRAIQQAFKTAKEQNKLILLDECDSLITERGDVGMILGSEINTLLTEIEKFEGICVLTTNRIDTLDEALERRISLIVEFPEPDFETREKLWAKLLPAKMPLAKNVVIAKLSEYKLSGGQIKNVVLQAARLAVANNENKVDKKYFETAILRIVKSKNLMGTASRFNQIKVRQDMGISKGVKKVVRQGADKVIS